MKSEIKIPAMGESISTVIIGQILKPNNTVVEADAEILELETDKVNQVLYAPQKGKITLHVNTGDKANIGDVIGFIESTAESASALSPPPPSPPSPLSTPKSAAASPEKQAAVPLPEEGNLRKNKEDFLKELSQPQPQSQTSISSQPDAKAPTAPSSRSSRLETRQPMSKIRKVIASRMVEAQRTTAMLTTFNEVDMSAVIQMRDKYKEGFSKKYGVKLGFMSFFVKASAAALKIYPIFNSYLDGEDVVHREYYDIGIAVGTDKGVIVPVLRECNQSTFSAIELSIENYAKKAREGNLKPDDLQGAGFTITNGGIYGSLLSTPILAPSQCGILGMHKIEKRPVVIDEQIVIRPMMYLALSYDHRLADGKEAVSFLVYIKNMLEDPSRLLLEI